MQVLWIQRTGSSYRFLRRPKRFSPLGRDAARRALGATGFVIGYAGRFIEEKGLFTVLKAMPRSQPEVKFYLLGSGPEQEALQREAHRMGISERVRFFPQCDANQVATFMRAIDVLVLMSKTTKTWKEQFGRVIIEAQACGTPVIGSDSGAIPSVVGKGGWILPESDSDALADLIQRLASDRAELRKAADEGLKSTALKYSPESIAHKLWSAFRIADCSNANRPGNISALAV